MKKRNAWAALIVGVLLALDGVFKVIDGGGFVRDVFVPAWIGYPLIMLGTVLGGIALYGLRHPAPPPNTKAEAIEAKAKMDQMYFNEYGVWPDYKEEPEVLPEKQAKSDQPNTGTEAGNANLKPTSPAESKPPVD